MARSVQCTESWGAAAAEGTVLRGDEYQVSKKKGGRVDSQWVSILQHTLASDNTR